MTEIIVEEDYSDEQINKIGWCGELILICFYISLIKPFVKLAQKKVTFESTPIKLVIVSYLHCLFWYFYGDLMDNYRKIHSNTIGCGITILLLFVYIGCELKKFLRDALINILLIIIGTSAIKRFLMIILYNGPVTKYICFVLDFALYLEPWLIVKKAHKNKNYNNFPVYSSIILCISCLYWSFFLGCILKEYFGLIINIIGMFSCLFQCAFYLKYGDRTFLDKINQAYVNVQRTDEEDKKKVLDSGKEMKPVKKNVNKSNKKGRNIDEEQVPIKVVALDQ